MVLLSKRRQGKPRGKISGEKEHSKAPGGAGGWGGDVACWKISREHHINEEWPLKGKLLRRVRKLEVNRKWIVVSEGHLRVKSALNVKEARSLQGMLRDSLTECKSVSQSFLEFLVGIWSESRLREGLYSTKQPHKPKMCTELPVWKTCRFTDPIPPLPECF